jgi:hypothetical protein
MILKSDIAKTISDNEDRYINPIDIFIIDIKISKYQKDKIYCLVFIGKKYYDIFLPCNSIYKQLIKG